MTVPAPVAAVPSTRRTSAARRAGRALLATATAAIVATGVGSGANLVSFEKTVEAMNSMPVLAN